MRQSSMMTRASRRLSNRHRFKRFVAEATVERFDPRVLPRRAGVDEDGVDGSEPAPVSDGMRNEFRAVVEPDVPRHATLERESIQDGDHRVGVDPALDEDHGTLPGEFVDDVQQLQRPSIGGGVEPGIQGPHHIRLDRAERADLRRGPVQPLRTAPLGHPESFLAPQAPHAFIVDDPPPPAGSFRCTPPPPPRALPGERHEQLPQLTLLLTRDRR